MLRFAQILVLWLLPCSSSASCIPFDQARNHLGETQCVMGKVIRVEEGSRGVRYLDFCEDYRLCTFSVVIFPHDLKKIGDVRQLAGKMVEIHGEVKEYDERAEIVLEDSKQLGGEVVHLSPLPKNFDVEERGHFSAGKFRSPRPPYSQKKRNFDSARRYSGGCRVGLGAAFLAREITWGE